MSDRTTSNTAVETPTTSETAPIDVQQRVASLRLEKVTATRSLLAGPLGFVAALILAAYFAVAYYRADAKGESASSETPADESAAEDPPVGPEIVLQASGHIAVRSSVHVNSRIRGIIVTLNIEEGQAVKEGDLLAELDDTSFRADAAEAKALLALKQARLSELRRGSRPEEIKQAEAMLQKARHRQGYLSKQRQRLNELMSRSAASHQDFELAESNSLEADAQVEELEATLKLVELGARAELIDAAAAEVERAEALVRKAEYYLESTRILSPVDGIVLEKSAELGQRIGLELGPSEVCVIAQQGDVEAVVDIHERDLELVRLGQPCVIRADSQPQYEMKGSLAWLSPLLDHQRSIREAKVRIVEPPDWVLPNMNCRVEVMRQSESQNDPTDLAREPGEQRANPVRAVSDPPTALD